MPTSFAHRVFALLLGAAAMGCGPKVGSDAPGAQSPERQAETEYDLARDMFGKGQPRQALDHALKAVALDEENSRILYFTSTVYLSFCSGDAGFDSHDCRPDDAERFARRAVKADGSFRDAKNLLGVILINRKKHAEAIAVLEPLTLDPAYDASHLAWGNLGWAQTEAGQLDLAIASLQNAVTHPKFCVGFYRLGIAYQKKGDLGQAEAALTRALEVDAPGCKELQDAWEARGRVRQALGRQAEALADFDRCKEISTTTPTGRQCQRASSQLGAGGAKASPLP